LGEHHIEEMPLSAPDVVLAAIAARTSRIHRSPAAAALLANSLDEDTVDWLKTNFFKTELELGHCLRLPQKGPCECDLYLRCSTFFTTSEYAPRRLAWHASSNSPATPPNTAGVAKSNATRPPSPASMSSSLSSARTPSPCH
jgi:hypothetical protein